MRPLESSLCACLLWAAACSGCGQSDPPSANLAASGAAGLAGHDAGGSSAGSDAAIGGAEAGPGGADASPDGSGGSAGSDAAAGHAGAGDAGAAGFVPEPGPRSVVYPADWTPGFETTRPGDGEKLFIQDFSYAGFEHGELPLPEGDFAPVLQVDASKDGSADATAAIQAALDQAAATAGGAIVLLPAGTYRVDAPLRVSGSSIVLRGAGADQTRLWFKDGAGLSTPAALTVTGANWLKETDAPGWVLTQDGAIFDTFVEVEDPAGLGAGDDISISWQITDEFKQEHNSEAYWYHLAVGDRRTFFRRTVTAVQGKRVHFKVPLRYPAKLRDNPTVRKASNYGSRNGVEHLSLNTALGSPEASWNSGTEQATALLMRSCKDCWIRGVSSFARDGKKHHLRSHGINVVTSFRVTVADSHLHNAEHLGGNGNGYLFQLMQSNELLVRDCTAEGGRHNFILNWDFGACGNVFLRVSSAGGRSCESLQLQLLGACGVGACDFHHALAMANLVDSSTINDALQVGNRQDWSTGAGQTGTMNVFWNLTGTGSVYAYNQGMGYAIGTGPGIHLSTDLSLVSWPEVYAAKGTAPQDFSEFVGTAHTLAPQSLYLEQLARRLAK